MLFLLNKSDLRSWNTVSKSPVFIMFYCFTNFKAVSDDVSQMSRQKSFISNIKNLNELLLFFFFIALNQVMLFLFYSLIFIFSLSLVLIQSSIWMPILPVLFFLCWITQPCSWVVQKVFLMIFKSSKSVSFYIDFHFHSNSCFVGKLNSLLIILSARSAFVFFHIDEIGLDSRRLYSCYVILYIFNVLSAVVTVLLEAFIRFKVAVTCVWYSLWNFKV